MKIDPNVRIEKLYVNLQKTEKNFEKGLGNLNQITKLIQKDKSPDHLERNRKLLATCINAKRKFYASKSISAKFERFFQKMWAVFARCFKKDVPKGEFYNVWKAEKQLKLMGEPKKEEPEPKKEAKDSSKKEEIQLTRQTSITESPKIVSDPKAALEEKTKKLGAAIAATIDKKLFDKGSFDKILNQLLAQAPAPKQEAEKPKKNTTPATTPAATTPATAQPKVDKKEDKPDAPKMITYSMPIPAKESQAMIEFRKFLDEVKATYEKNAEEGKTLFKKFPEYLAKVNKGEEKFNGGILIKITAMILYPEKAKEHCLKAIQSLHEQFGKNDSNDNVRRWGIQRASEFINALYKIDPAEAKKEVNKLGEAVEKMTHPVHLLRSTIYFALALALIEPKEARGCLSEVEKSIPRIQDPFTKAIVQVELVNALMKIKYENYEKEANEILDDVLKLQLENTDKQIYITLMAADANTRLKLNKVVVPAEDSGIKKEFEDSLVSSVESFFELFKQNPQELYPIFFELVKLLPKEKQDVFLNQSKEEINKIQTLSTKAFLFTQLASIYVDLNQNDLAEGILDQIHSALKKALGAFNDSAQNAVSIMTKLFVRLGKMEKAHNAIKLVDRKESYLKYMAKIEVADQEALPALLESIKKSNDLDVEKKYSLEMVVLDRLGLEAELKDLKVKLENLNDRAISDAINNFIELSKIYAKRNQYDEAISLLVTAEKVNGAAHPKAQDYAFLAKANYELNLPEASLQRLLDLATKVNHKPKNAAARQQYVLGLITAMDLYSRLEKYQDAVKVLQKAQNLFKTEAAA